MATVVAVECAWCGEQLNTEEIEHPNPGVDEPICDECYDEHFRFICFWCEAYEHVDFQDKVLVIKEDCGGLPSGVYNILRLPYFTSNYFDMWWNPSALEKVRDIPADWTEEENYPSGHLCQDCQKKIMTAPTGWIGQRLT